MTREQKDLLLKDLCARIPYGVKVSSKIPINQNGYKDVIGKVTSVHYDNSIVQVEGFDVIADYSPHFEIKPYLFPLSSMTEEQKKELNKLSEKECYIIEDVVNNPTPSNVGFPVVVHYMVDWCNKNHFDYRGLIPMGLANDATGLNIY